MTTISFAPPTDPLVANVRIPGSKSFTNRALICAILADEDSKLVGASNSFDSRLLISALRQLGANIRTCEDHLCISGGSLRPFSGTIDVGPAGTTMRFLTALCALTPGTDVEIRGSHRMHQRPIGALVNGLTQLGADIEHVETPGCPPLRIRGKSLSGGTVHMDGSTSSQFLTALLLTAPLLPDGLRLEVSGEIVSESYLNMTAETMRAFGVDVSHPDERTWVVNPGQKYRATEYEVEADLTGATYFAGLAAINGGTIQIHPVRNDSTQGDVQFSEILKKMDCVITHTGDVLIVSGPEKLCAITADLSLLPDAAQTLAVVAACAEGTSRITGLSTLRDKECDRIEAIQSELKKLDISTRSGPDWIEIDGGIPKTGQIISTFDDHRMAMAFSLISGRTAVTIDHPHVVRKSFPDFWKMLRQCGIISTAATRIIPSVIGRTVDELVAQIDKLPPSIEIIELRVDRIEQISKSTLDELHTRVQRPAILTCRSVADGGDWKSTESDRLELLRHAARQNWAFVDIELAIAAEWPWEEFRKQAFLLSWHDVLGTPDDLEKIWNEMQQYPASLKKIIPTTRSESDAERILDLCERHAGQNLIAFGMGELGKFTRFESVRRGTWGSFASVNEATAPGQYHWRELQNIIETIRYPR